MRFSHIDHIGIAVENLDQAIATYTTLHGMPPSRITEVSTEHVKVALFPIGPTKIELLAATNPQSPIAKFLAKHGPGLHHICYAVNDFSAVVRELTTAGMQCIERPTTHGAEGTRIAFFHPKSTGGVLIELTELSK